MSQVEVISPTTDPFLHLPIIEKEKIITGYKYLGEIFTGKPLTDNVQEST